MSREVWFHLHVPKCAGSTVEQHVAAHLGGEAFLRPTRRHGIGYYFGRGYDIPVQRELSAIRFVSGHFFGRSVEQLFSSAEIRRTVLLRDPLSYTLSLYNYRMRRYQKQGAGVVPFDVWRRSRGADPISTFILNRYLEIPLWRLLMLDRAAKAELLGRALEGFDFVGDISSCCDFVAQLSQRMGIPGVNARRNVTPTDERLIHADNLSASVLAEIRASTALDQWLWESYRERGWERWGRSEVPKFSGDGASSLIGELRRGLYSVVARSIRGRLSGRPSLEEIERR